MDNKLNAMTDGLKAEMKRVIRCFNKFSPETRANHSASHRLGYQQRKAVGDFFYTHPDAPGVAFKTRSAAARAVVAKAGAIA